MGFVGWHEDSLARERGRVCVFARVVGIVSSSMDDAQRLGRFIASAHMDSPRVSSRQRPEGRSIPISNSNAVSLRARG